MRVHSKKIAILMCTFNGERFLEEQLNSFLNQTHKNFDLWVSDDGSHDRTLNILTAFSEKHPGRLKGVFRGPSDGHAANFLSLLARTEIYADYYAFSDQDDIWGDQKLEQALNRLVDLDDNIPLLYCNRTEIVDENNRTIGLSPIFDRPPSFQNALVQSIAGGNTMVFNNRTRDLLIIGGFDTPVAHDWWAYIVVAGCGGVVLYDTSPSLRYRQHSANVIGVNSSWLGRIARLRMLLNGRFRDWNNANIKALTPLHKYLTADSLRCLSDFSAARQSHLALRILKFKKSGIYRQTLFGNLSLIAAAIMKKI